MATGGRAPIAVALAAVCDERGLTSADLVRIMRTHGVPAPTMRNIIEGRVRTPGLEIRQALDEEFAGGIVGLTLRIAEGREPGYPTGSLLELAGAARLLSDEAIEHLVEFLRAVL